MPESFNFHKISISTSTIIKFFLVGILLFALYYIRDVALIVIASIILASAIEPMIKKLQGWRVHRVLAVILVYLFIAILFGALLVFFIPVVANDLVSLLNNLPQTFSLESLWAPVQNLGFHIGDTAIAPDSISIKDFITTLQTIVTGSSTGAIKTASLIFGGVLGLILIVVLSFYLAVQEDGVGDFLRIITPVRRHGYITDLWKRSQHKIGAWLQGQLLLGLVVGILVYLVLMIVGIPHALLLALLAAVFEIIPVFGPIISSVPAILIAFADGGIGTGFLLIGLYIIIYQFESQLFYPLVVKKIVGISPIVVILALVIGAKLAGVLGALIAVPLSAVLMEYVNDIDRSKKEEIAQREKVAQK
ncbi:MAG TPA: AI-2E family transporter [Candidatus Paceibacterota bacterium]